MTLLMGSAFDCFAGSGDDANVVLLRRCGPVFKLDEKLKRLMRHRRESDNPDLFEFPGFRVALQPKAISRKVNLSHKVAWNDDALSKPTSGTPISSFRRIEFLTHGE